MKAALILACLLGTASAQTVLLPESMKAEVAGLAEKHPTLELDFYANAAEAKEKIATAEGYVGTPDEGLLETGAKLRWVHIHGAGIERYTALPKIKDGTVALTNFKIQQGPEIADHAFALLLSLTRNMAAYQRAQADGAWGRNDAKLPMIELRGRTMMVIGYGGIGTQVAERAKAFGMKVIAIDPKDLPISQTLDRSGKPDELDELLPEADVVVSCVPHTPQTEKMLGTAQFTAMKKGAYLINVSRGKIVDTDALVKALQEKKLAGAGLDVTDPEPLPKDHPLWKMDNVVITPHVAWASDQRPERQDQLVLTNLSRFARGMALSNRVDPAKGY
ncbi:D-2-hydroxyacid dehydrogenase [Luteolibacter flavescens]|uniref:D-2-hydroxyacid dehydrogenase n=1 Tax=Luteolibacter flavescens TaxID=1859460 RepID=A0ABT3FPC4_9BACT|nr:D-2-hydroxyacid dehydrogenase [Luteolibacter flavescens]MCW1885425.1 D-2-hydroxyacid dehydrogenase [Luteolibacter flavescens]